MSPASAQIIKGKAKKKDSQHLLNVVQAERSKAANDVNPHVEGRNRPAEVRTRKTM